MFKGIRFRICPDKEHRKLSRKQIGSNNRNKQRMQVAKLQEKITNQRNDFLQKQSTKLICENQTICIEDLNVKGMICNQYLNQRASNEVCITETINCTVGHTGTV